MAETLGNEAEGENPTDPRSPRIWHERDERIIRFLEKNPATTAQLARFFSGRTLETKYKSACRRLGKLRKRKKIRVIGVIQHRTGRPEVVYGRKWKDENLFHDVLVTEFLLILGEPFERNVKVGNVWPDAVLTRKGQRCLVEVDTGKMSRKQMQRKWKKYETTGFLLVVCLTEKRLQVLISCAEPVKSIALFTTFDRLKSGKPWSDGFGKTLDV